MFTKIKTFVSDNFELVWFSTSIIIMVFIAGIAVGRFEVFPYTLFKYAKSGVEDWQSNWKQNLKVVPNKHIGPSRGHDPAVVINKPDAWGGVTLIATFIRDEQTKGPGLVLLNMDGNVLHKWFIPIDEVFPGTEGNIWDTLITGFHLFDNGDVVFNFTGVGTVKLDACSNILWSSEHGAHHNLSIGDDDTIWTAGMRKGDRLVFNTQYPKRLRIEVPDTIIQLSPDGELLQEIDALRILLASELKGALFANGQQRLYHKKVSSGFEFTHLNDVEVLPAGLATGYPLFSAGDVMLSFRNLNLIVVIDGDSHAVKWSFSGPFLRQHDPDFIGSGVISVFDNMGAGPADDIGFASRILSIDTNTGAVETTYKAPVPEDFYTHERGAHQALPNGNLLITETFAGRIFEVDTSGEIVWQYITAWDDQQVIHPFQAKRYDDPDGFFAGLSCDP